MSESVTTTSGHDIKMQAKIGIWLFLFLASQKCFGFTGLVGRGRIGSCLLRRDTELRMVFDFLRKRSEEGIEQVQNIASKTMEGKLGEALQDTSDYISSRQKADLENLKRLSDGLAKSRARILGGISGIFEDNSLDITMRLEKLEELLLQSDIGPVTTSQIISDLGNYAKTEGLEADDIVPVLRARLIEALTPPEGKDNLQVDQGNQGNPRVIFVIGANGMGKTTTIGKISARLVNEFNMTVLLGACDTFRAAAVEQLDEWANRTNASIEKPFEEERGRSPVSVVRRSIERGKRDGYDVVIIDTSGRLSNNFELIEELKDMKTAIQREISTAPEEILLVVDGSVGRNALDQAKAWTKYVGVSGIVVTKMDGTARGGFVVSIVKDLGIPVKFIGVGEKIDDLRDFNPETFVDALLGNDAVKSAQLKERADKMFGFSGTSNIAETNNIQSSSTMKIVRDSDNAGVSSSLIESFQSKKNELNEEANGRKKKKRRKNRK